MKVMMHAGMFENAACVRVAELPEPVKNQRSQYGLPCRAQFFDGSSGVLLRVFAASALGGARRRIIHSQEGNHLRKLIQQAAAHECLIPQEVTASPSAPAVRSAERPQSPSSGAFTHRWSLLGPPGERSTSAVMLTTFTIQGFSSG